MRPVLIAADEKIQKSFHLPAGLWDRLKEVAQAEHRSINSTIVMLIERYVVTFEEDEAS